MLSFRECLLHSSDSNTCIATGIYLSGNGATFLMLHRALAIHLLSNIKHPYIMLAADNFVGLSLMVVML